MEQWKDIEGYEGLYQVSTSGKVKSLGVYRNCYIEGGLRKTIFISQARTMKPFNNGHGYMVVALTKDGNRKNHYIHRLVAEAFKQKIVGKEYINHLDYNRANNNVENLEWCTQKENVTYSRQNYRRQHQSNTSTGERYITRKKGRNLYRVCIKKANTDKCFKNLSAAILYRNEVLNEINYSI